MMILDMMIYRMMNRKGCQYARKQQGTNVSANDF
jgi:hypothetical protein